MATMKEAWVCGWMGWWKGGKSQGFDEEEGVG